MGLAIAWLAILGTGGGRVVSTIDSAAGHASLVADSVVSSAGGSQLSVTGALGGLVAAPEGFPSLATGVVVGWGWAVLLLLLVMADEEDVEDGAGEEEQDCRDRHGEARSVECAGVTEITGAGGFCVARASTDGSVDDTRA